MESITMEETFQAEPDAVLDLVTDPGPFLRAAGFDHVAVNGGEIHIENSVGLATIELDLEIMDDSAATLAYEQTDGIFETMTTTYNIEKDDATTTLIAKTEFALDVALVGMILDATVIKRQRRKELSAQFEYLREELPDASPEQSGADSE